MHTKYANNAQICVVREWLDYVLSLTNEALFTECNMHTVTFHSLVWNCHVSTQPREDKPNTGSTVDRAS